MSESSIETPALATALVRGSVLVGVLASLIQLNLLDAGVLALLGGVLLATGLLRSSRRTGPSRAVASCLLSLAGTAVAATIALGLIATYESFSILTVPIPSLIARAVPFLLLSLAVVLATVGATGLRHGPRLARGATPATTSLAVVVLVQSVLSTVLLWDLLVRNLAALGFGPVEFLFRVLFGIGTVGPAPGAFLFLSACAFVLAGLTLVRLETDRPSARGQWLLVLGVLAGGLAAPATVATYLGALARLAQLSPALYGLVTLVTTNVLVRLLLIGTLVASAGLLTVRRVDSTSARNVLSPAVAVVGGLCSPLLLAVLVETLPIVEYLLGRAPPDAETVVREMLAISGPVPLLVGASTAATILVALSVTILSLLIDASYLPVSTLPASLAGTGTISAGVAVVVHEPSAFSGFLAVAAGLLAWELGIYGRSIADSVGANGDPRVTLVRTGSLAGVLSVALLVSYGVATLVSRVDPAGPQTGVAALLVLVGVLLVVGSLRH